MEIFILIFIFVLVILWYIWWCYNELTNDFNDTEDMLVDLLNMSALDLKAEGTTVTIKLPKRVKKRIDNNYQFHFKKNILKKYF